MYYLLTHIGSDFDGFLDLIRYMLRNLRSGNHDSFYE
jgi:hypothetical protein